MTSTTLEDRFIPFIVFPDDAITGIECCYPIKTFEDLVKKVTCNSKLEDWNPDLEEIKKVAPPQEVKQKTIQDWMIKNM
jgi:hypothetical protein